MKFVSEGANKSALVPVMVWSIFLLIMTNDIYQWNGLALVAYYMHRIQRMLLNK